MDNVHITKVVIGFFFTKKRDRSAALSTVGVGGEGSSLLLLITEGMAGAQPHGGGDGYIYCDSSVRCFYISHIN